MKASASDSHTFVDPPQPVAAARGLCVCLLAVSARANLCLELGIPGSLGLIRLIGSNQFPAANKSPGNRVRTDRGGSLVQWAGTDACDLLIDYPLWARVPSFMEMGERI